MHPFKVGDSVTILHDTIEGKVIEILPNQIKIEDSDGFERTFPKNRVVLKQGFDSYRIEADIIRKDSIKESKLNAKQTQRKFIKNSPVERVEIDLHIEELREHCTHLTNFEIVQIQMTACRAFVQESIELGRKKVVLIHGKGQGVLKSEIHQYLDRLSNNSGIQLEYHDAPFSRYGVGGATQVLFYG